MGQTGIPIALLSVLFSSKNIHPNFVRYHHLNEDLGSFGIFDINQHIIYPLTLPSAAADVKANIVLLMAV